jgi:hypothetical protein
MTSIRSSASLPISHRVTDRDVWIKAGAILAEHGDGTADYIICQLGDVLDSQAAIEHWRRVAAAVDAIADAKPRLYS